MRGRKPSSPKVQDLKSGKLQVIDGGGHDGEPPDDDNEPHAPPHWLTNEHARFEWYRLVPKLKARKQYIEEFETELARYCDALGIYIEARQKLAAEGLVKMRGTGGEMSSAYHHILSREHEKMLRLAGDLGLNPVAQVRLAGLQLDLFDEAPRGTGTDGPSNPFGGFRR